MKNNEYLIMDNLIDKTRERSSFSDFSGLVEDILGQHHKTRKLSQTYINEIYGEIVPLKIFSNYIKAQFVELCPKNAKFDAKVYLEGGIETLLEITRMGMTHQSDLQLEHCSKFGYVDPNVNVKSDGTKASGNRVIQEQTENTMVSEEEIKRKFKEDLNNAIEKKIKKSDKADFAGWLLVSFEFGDYTLNIQCIKDVLSKTTVRSEGFSKIYVVGSPWEGYESLVYEMK